MASLEDLLAQRKDLEAKIFQLNEEKRIQSENEKKWYVIAKSDDNRNIVKIAGPLDYKTAKQLINLSNQNSRRFEKRGVYYIQEGLNVISPEDDVTKMVEKINVSYTPDDHGY